MSNYFHYDDCVKTIVRVSSWLSRMEEHIIIFNILIYRIQNIPSCIFNDKFIKYLTDVLYITEVSIMY